MIIDTHLHHYEAGFRSKKWHDYVAADSKAEDS